MCLLVFFFLLFLLYYFNFVLLRKSLDLLVVKQLSSLLECLIEFLMYFTAVICAHMDLRKTLSESNKVVVFKQLESEYIRLLKCHVSNQFIHSVLNP